MQNTVLFRLRQRGQNFGNMPQNTNTDYDPPYLVKLALNTAYSEFLDRTKAVFAAPIIIASATVANTQRLPLNPVPVASALCGVTNLALATMTYPAAAPFAYANPYVMNVHEFTYVQQTTSTTSPGPTRYIPIIATDAFRRFTGIYLQRQGASSAFPRRVSQMKNQQSLELYPGLATANDTIVMTVTPDPQATDAYYKGTGQYPCARGGIMYNDADIPLIASQFHMALVEHAIANLALAADKTGQAELSMARYEAKVQECLDSLIVLGEGASEQRVEDPWSNAFDADAAIV